MIDSSEPAAARERPRVVITGMGTVNALTSGGRSAVAGALALGRSGIGPIRAFAPDQGTGGLAAEIDQSVNTQGQLSVGYVLVGRAILDDFEDTGSIVAWFLGIVGTLLALCTAAAVASLSLLRRRRWAWWALLVLCPVTAVLGVVAGYYLLPLGVAAAASAVFVLLLLPSTRVWLASATP